MSPVGVNFRGAEGNVGYLLRQAHQMFRSAMETALRGSGITASQYSILSTIELIPGCSGAELALESVMTVQSASELVATLEKAGLIQRNTGPDDRRIRRIHLTQTGQEVLNQTTPQVRALEDRMTNGLTDEGRRQFRAWLARAAVELSTVTGHVT